MPTTSNFGWTTPADTDLVKDGAAAIRTLGNGIDTSFLDLKGGTTGQVLSKNSNTDLDFTWVAQDDSNAIQNDIVDAKGDLISATAADTPARLAVGTNGHILTADSSTSTGLKWAAPAGGGKLLQLVSATTNTGVTNTTDNYADTGLTATITPTSATSKILVIISQAIECDVSSGNTGTEINATINLLRGATSIWQANRALMTSDGTTTAHFVAAHISITCYDDPATTSATTYKTQFRRYNGATRSIAQWADEMRSTITLMEIGA